MCLKATFHFILHIIHCLGLDGCVRYKSELINLSRVTLTLSASPMLVLRTLGIHDTLTSLPPSLLPG